MAPRSIVTAALLLVACSREPPPPAVVPPAVAKAPPPAATLPAAIDAAIDGAAPAPPAPPPEATAAGADADECASTPAIVPTIAPPDRVAFQDPTTERWGYKTAAGKLVIPARYREAAEFGARGAAAVTLDIQEGNPFRFIDPAGAELGTAFIFDNGPDAWSDGFARIVDGKGQFGFVDQDGKVAIPPRYTFAYPFCRGVAKVAIGDAPGYIDAAGKPAPAVPGDTRPTIPERHVD